MPGDLSMTEDSTNSQPKLLLGRIGPAVVLICLLLDISLRFMPPRLIAFRAWESMTLFATGDGPFIPNAVYRSKRSSGDLASLANLPDLRQYREEVFSTDSAGYRNRRETATPFSGILVLGDSFTAGNGVSDAFTLSEQLHEISGFPVYNGAESPNFWQLLEHLQMNRGLVIYQQLERAPLPYSLVASALPDQSLRRRLVRKVFGDQRAETLRRRYASADKWFRAFKSYSPVKILSGRAVKFLQNDKIFPNPYGSAVVASKLRNGREILFLPTELNTHDPRKPTNPVGFIQLKLELQKRGIGLLVLLVPDKYTIYRDLLSPASPETERQFLDVVEQHLAAANVPVLNLTPLFRRQAEALFPRDEYLYWLDDSHWNAEGIREAAQAIADSPAVSECSCRD
jgi:hypothetical protein